ncbi:MAG: hypothetical protein U0X91_16430 [Spirosomataceae bacterium]
MANDYDKIFKENIESLIPFLARKVLGIEAEILVELPDEIQLTVERKPDFLKKVIPTDGAEPYLLHLEFQTAVDKDMPYRMLEYFALLLRKYRLPVKQYVVYLNRVGSKSPISKHNFTGCQFEYNQRSLQLFDYELFLNSTSPEEVLLAILANFKNSSPELVAQRIIAKLQQLEPNHFHLSRYANQLVVLSGIRNLDETTLKILEDMPITNISLEDFYTYRKGMEKGIEKGIEKGMKKGIEKNQKGVVINMLRSQLLTIEQIADLAGVDQAYVLKIQTELLPK